MTKGVDKNRSITIRQNAVVLSMCTAMAAEVVRASVLAGILDFRLGKNLRLEAINKCIDAVITTFGDVK